MTDLLAPVCRHCGNDELHSIEKQISWQRVNWICHPEIGWVTGEEWGDTVGDSSSDSVGIACGYCYAEEADFSGGGKWDAGALIVTREEYEATHPVLTWIVNVERLVRPWALGRPAEIETRTLAVEARDVRGACERATQVGMQEDGSYPWRPSYPPTAVQA